MARSSPRIEFRDKSWFDDEVAGLMAHERLAVCQSDAADWPIWRAVTTDLVFVRLHGHQATYASNYNRASLVRWAKRVREWIQEGRSVHVYFDNDAKGYAPWNALEVARILGLGKRSAQAPEPDQSSTGLSKRDESLNCGLTRLRQCPGPITRVSGVRTDAHWDL
jgi:uncharacterized protein YecE (DUF72 family)